MCGRIMAVTHIPGRPSLNSLQLGEAPTLLLSLILCLKILVHHPQDQANINVLRLSKILPFPTHCIVPCQDISPTAPPVTMLISITGPSCSLSLLSIAFSHISFPATILNRQKSNDGKVKTFVAKIDMFRRAMKVHNSPLGHWASCLSHVFSGLYISV